MRSEISRQMWGGIWKGEMVNPDDPDQDNGTKLLNYCIVIGPSQFNIQGVSKLNDKWARGERWSRICSGVTAPTMVFAPFLTVINNMALKDLVNEKITAKLWNLWSQYLMMRWKQGRSYHRISLSMIRDPEATRVTTFPLTGRSYQKNGTRRTSYASGWKFGLAIHQNDHQARRRFFEWAQNEITVVPDFHKRILFSDEAHFWLNGYVNKQNCRIWSEANSQVYVETPLHPEKLTVWCALWAGGIVLQKR
ncbi:uncharacterized protein TNCV_1065741 [Trichonephila clavipes]|nr:uncharacterized protein TNCV_1065741 [Trichonephila clavipes]